MIDRAAIERALLDEERALDQVSELLEAGSALEAWPEDLRAALALALTDGAMSRAESWKAVTLRRHLFGPADRVPGELTVPSELSATDRRRAERLRSDLPARVRYRAGAHLLVQSRAATPAPE